MLKRIIRKLLPKNFLFFYHKALAYLAAFFYGWPSRKMIVIGVTGTGGKSTVVNFIGRILEEVGYKVGWTSTINFKIGDREWLNKTKMTMPGRFYLQKLLKRMLQAGCQYAIIETSSEGLVQSRHLGINYDLALITNLFPEHLESHGGFENYKKAKAKLFQHLSRSKNKVINGQKILKKIVVNLNDQNAEYFLSFKADEYYGYKLKDWGSKIESLKTDHNLKIIEAENVKLTPGDFGFMIDGVGFKIHLPGKFNIENALAAITLAVSQGVSLESCRRTLDQIKSLPGRLEEINEGQNFRIFVDYAHTPDSLEAVYRLMVNLKQPGSRIIAVLGACGGGRDKWKRPVMGKLASQYCDYIVLTNEDPYDEDPGQILSQIRSGILNSTFNPQNLFEILDRREAIKKALSLARLNDIVVITGKGCEPWIVGSKGKKIPWDDREVVREEIKKLQENKL
jgi:UDP-N-acetylmuramoyl-L-alanyl-D-glutamate--2,6-diaminopimelate ligase